MDKTSCWDFLCNYYKIKKNKSEQLEKKDGNKKENYSCIESISAYRYCGYLYNKSQDFAPVFQ